MIQIVSDWSEVEKELDRVENMPDFKTRLALDIVLQQGYVETQKDVHVDTGSLQGSGKVESETDKLAGKWEGKISYGGPSTGVNNPVDYAIYEKRRGIGGAGGPSDAKGDHDFFASLPALHKKYIEALQIGLKG